MSRLETVSHIHWCMELRLTSCRMFVLLALSLGPLAAEAQDKVGISLSAGAVRARLGTARRVRQPLLAVSIQRVFWDHFVVEGELTHWTYLRHLEFGPRNVIGQQGVIGSVTSGEVDHARSYWNYGPLNLLLKSTGRVRVLAAPASACPTTTTTTRSSRSAVRRHSRPPRVIASPRITIRRLYRARPGRRRSANHVARRRGRLAAWGKDQLGRCEQLAERDGGHPVRVLIEP